MARKQSSVDAQALPERDLLIVSKSGIRRQPIGVHILNLLTQLEGVCILSTNVAVFIEIAVFPGGLRYMPFRSPPKSVPPKIADTRKEINSLFSQHIGKQGAIPLEERFKQRQKEQWILVGAVGCTLEEIRHRWLTSLKRENKSQYLLLADLFDAAVFVTALDCALTTECPIALQESLILLGITSERLSRINADKAMASYAILMETNRKKASDRRLNTLLNKEEAFNKAMITLKEESARKRGVSPNLPPQVKAVISIMEHDLELGTRVLQDFVNKKKVLEWWAKNVVELQLITD
jgi:hypothetical protein